MCRTFVFAGRRGTLEGSQAWRQRRRSTQFVEKSPRPSFANELCVRPLAFVAPGRNLVSNLVASAHLRTLLATARAQARPILATWTDPDRPTSIDLGASIDSETPTFIDLGSYRANYRASLRSGQVSRFPAALGSPSGQVDLARYRASLPRSAYQRYD